LLFPRDIVGAIRRNAPLFVGASPPKRGILPDLSGSYREVPSPGGVAAKQTGWVRILKKLVFCASFHRVLIKSGPPEVSNKL